MLVDIVASTILVEMTLQIAASAILFNQVTQKLPTAAIVNV